MKKKIKIPQMRGILEKGKKFFLTFFVFYIAFSLIISPTAQARYKPENKYRAQLADYSGVLPGSPFYFFDKMLENIDLLLTLSPEKKSEKLIDVTKERAEELEILMAAQAPQAEIAKSNENVEDSLKNLAEKIGAIDVSSEAGKKFLDDLKDPQKREQIILSLDKSLPKSLQGRLNPALGKLSFDSQEIIDQSKEKAQEVKVSLVAKLKEKSKELAKRVFSALVDFVKNKLRSFWDGVKSKFRDGIKKVFGSLVDRVFK